MKKSIKKRIESIEPVGIGRGMSFRRNLRETTTQDGEPAWEVYGEPHECLLVLVPGLYQDDPDTRMPMLLFPDGVGEVAISFETRDENGNWQMVDLTKLF